MFKGGKKQKFFNYFLFAVAVIVAYELINLFPWSLDGIKMVAGVCAPIFVGFLIAFILYVPSQKLEDLFKKLKEKNFFNKHARGFSVLISYIGFFLVVGLLIYAIIPTFIKNVVELSSNVPKYGSEIVDFFLKYANADGKLFGIDVKETVDKIPEAMLGFFSVEKVTEIIGGAYAVGSAIVQAFLSIIISVYMLLGRDSLIKACGRVFGIALIPEKVHNVRRYLRRISDIFYNYFYSQLLDGLLVSVIFSIAFWIIGIPYPIFFGLFMGLCNLIPYFGAIVGGVAVSVVALVTLGLTTALITAVVIVVLMQLDANIFQPKIVGATVGIRPVYVLVAITLGGGFFGFAGILLSVPIMATIRMILLDVSEIVEAKRMRKELEEDSEE